MQLQKSGSRPAPWENVQKIRFPFSTFFRVCLLGLVILCGCLYGCFGSLSLVVVAVVGLSAIVWLMLQLFFGLLGGTC